MTPDAARLSGLAFAVAAPVCWSVGGPVMRLVEASAWDIVFWRSLGHGVLFVVVLAAWQGKRAATDFLAAGRVGWLSAACICGTFVAHVLAIANAPVANVLVVQSLSPLLVACFAWALLGESLSGRQIAAAAAAFAGLIVVMSGALGPADALGTFIALVVAVLSTVNVLLVRSRRAVGMLPASIPASLGALAVGALLGAPGEVAAGERAILMGLGMVQMTAGLTFFLLALRTLPAAPVTLISLIEPVLGALWAWLVLGEVPAATTLIGGAVMLAALAALVAAKSEART